MVFKKTLIFILLILQASLSFSRGNHFIYAQLRFPGNWDPHPDAYQQIYYYLSNTTSLRVERERKTVTLTDEELFFSPFLVFTGRGGYPEFSDEEIVNLRRYIQGGGIVLIDTGGDLEFNECADRTIKRAFPEKNYIKVPQNHALYKSFYLVDFVSGRYINSPYLEGMETGGRLAVIKTANDLIGAWPRDRMGNFKYELVPDKTGQRKEAVKLMLNILMYSVCGTYKSDPVHQPFIREKLGR